MLMENIEVGDMVFYTVQDSHVVETPDGPAPRYLRRPAMVVDHDGTGTCALLLFLPNGTTDFVDVAEYSAHDAGCADACGNWGFR